jgi:hypothetical protein
MEERLPADSPSAQRIEDCRLHIADWAQSQSHALALTVPKSEISSLKSEMKGGAA